MVSGVEDIRESLRILLGTVPGERVMLPDYGCPLDRFLFRERTTALMEEIRERVTSAIFRWEKRIDILACDVVPDRADPALVRIELSYLIRRTNRKDSFLHPLNLGDSAPAEGR
jgi:hypothetical protein